MNPPHGLTAVLLFEIKASLAGSSAQRHACVNQATDGLVVAQASPPAGTSRQPL